MIDNECVCAMYPDQGDYDGQPHEPEDASFDAPVPVYEDVWTGYDAGMEAFDAPYTYYYEAGPPYCGVYCGNGYSANEYCECVPCANVCPPGQMPAAGCGACTACSQLLNCPVGFDEGPNCGCVPHGVDAGPPPPPADAGLDGGSAGCVLEGYQTCAVGAWCQLGTCPDEKTQYGCYCNADGTATCNLACPAPPVCTIPGLGTCAAGSECAFGTCSGDAGSLLYCDCQSTGDVYCNTISCADSYYLPEAGASPGDAGPSCYLQGYTQCPVGQYCQLGTCPSGTPYGCTCNADGTTRCNLVCPPPGPCMIPGLGTCPYGQDCTFGSCDAGSGSELVCYCEQNGEATCYSSACGAVGGEGG
jgi:hypothetical protein